MLLCENFHDLIIVTLNSKIPGLKIMFVMTFSGSFMSVGTLCTPPDNL